MSVRIPLAAKNKARTFHENAEVNLIETNKKTMKNRIYFWGVVRLCLGVLLAVLLWIIFTAKGLAVYSFVFSIAVALSGLLSIVTGKSFSELSDVWSNLNGFLKLILTIGICIGLYFGILLVGVIVTNG